ncbi:hypothetical protein [Pedobacter antarcticus]|uniref:hypothetical protein n=1 Tax=Pedobacter antarcticus TaxID=34086 RepID=UPI00292F10EB|nr:hypothetical protein [Pedobacter antarcticus]
MAKNSNTETENKTEEIKKNKPTCGLIMPISKIDGLGPKHWAQVKAIITEALQDRFLVNLVSDADDASVIHGVIVNNVFESDMVVCDVSCKNPNVMFELGMRLAIDKPTILIMDDATDYIFDTTPIEHIKYSRNLNYYDIEEFKIKLSKKVNATFDNFKKDGHKSFKDHFSKITVKGLKTVEGDIFEYMKTEFENLNKKIAQKGHPESYYKISDEMIGIVEELAASVVINDSYDIIKDYDRKIDAMTEFVLKRLELEYALPLPVQRIRSIVEYMYMAS